MTPEQPPKSFLSAFTSYLPLAEKILLALSAIGIILAVYQLGTTVATIALSSLAATYYLFAYRPNTIPEEERELAGFSSLLGFTILSKILWISCAISLIAIQFYLMGLGNNSYQLMAMIGGPVIAIGSIALVFLMTNGTKHIETVVPVLYRAVPLCAVDFYLMFK